MKKYIRYTAAILALGVCFSSTGAFFEEPLGYANSTLKGLKTISVNIDPPRGSDYTAMSVYGVTREKLHEMVSSRLRDAGFNVVNYTESLTDPDAVLLDLRVRVDMPRGSFYAFDVKLSVNKKVLLTQDSGGPFYSVRTWSARQIGAVQSVGTGLAPLYTYSMQLVDSFIKEHHAQN